MIDEVIVRVLFLVFISGLGWVVGTTLRVSSKDISSLLIYIISPFVIFVSILGSPATIEYFEYSLAALLTASTAATLAYGVARLLWQDGRINLFSFAGGTGNTGYFALPLVFALFNEKQIAIAVFIILGINIYEFTVGYFITAKGVFNAKDSLGKILRLPIFYAAALGMLCKGLKINFGQTLLSSISNFKGAYSVLGMMVIGITLAAYRKLTSSPC